MLILGVISELPARDRDGWLSEDELVKVSITLLFAGHEATSTQIPNVVYFLLGQAWTCLFLEHTRG